MELYSLSKLERTIFLAVSIYYLIKCHPFPIFIHGRLYKLTEFKQRLSLDEHMSN